MFGMLENLTKAAVSVALTPVAVAVDVVRLPVSSSDNTNPFAATEALVDNAAECTAEALKPNRS